MKQDQHTKELDDLAYRIFDVCSGYDIADMLTVFFNVARKTLEQIPNQELCSRLTLGAINMLLPAPDSDVIEPDKQKSPLGEILDEEDEDICNKMILTKIRILAGAADCEIR